MKLIVCGKIKDRIFKHKTNGNNNEMKNELYKICGCVKMYKSGVFSAA